MDFYFSDDGIVISISIWQCLFEFLTNCLFSGIVFVFKENSYNLLEFKIQEFVLSKGKFQSYLVCSETKLRKSHLELRLYTYL